MYTSKIDLSKHVFFISRSEMAYCITVYNLYLVVGITYSRRLILMYILALQTFNVLWTDQSLNKGRALGLLHAAGHVVVAVVASVLTGDTNDVHTYGPAKTAPIDLLDKAVTMTSLSMMSGLLSVVVRIQPKRSLPLYGQRGLHSLKIKTKTRLQTHTIFISTFKFDQIYVTLPKLASVARLLGTLQMLRMDVWCTILKKTSGTRQVVILEQNHNLIISIFIFPILPARFRSRHKNPTFESLISVIRVFMAAKSGLHSHLLPPEANPAPGFWPRWPSNLKW